MKTCKLVVVILMALALCSAALAQDAQPPILPGAGGLGGYGGGGRTPSYGGGTGNLSIGGPKASVVAVDQAISRLQSQLAQLRIQYGLLQQQIDQTKKMIGVGKEPSGQSLPALQAQTAQVQAQFEQIDRELTSALRLKALASPVDVTLKSSSIRQAAEALSRASKVNISVDPKVPQDLKVNAESQNVPLGAVLEVIADAAGLIIAPTEDGGLLLRMPGKLVVGNNTYTTDGDNTPWSDDWGAIGRLRLIGIGRRWLELFNAYSDSYNRYSRDFEGGYGGMGGMTGPAPVPVPPGMAPRPGPAPVAPPPTPDEPASGRDKPQGK